VARVEDCLNIADLRALAEHRLPRSIRPLLDGAAEDGLTADRNVSAFENVSLLPRCLVDVTEVATRTALLGQTLEWPVYCSPTGASRLFHPDGELAVARAAASTGTVYGLSSNSTHPLEVVAAAAPGPKFFQLFLFKDRTLTYQLMERCRAAGYQALLLTVDVPVRGNCEREQRLAQSWSVRAALSFATHPAWSLGQLRRGRLSIPIMGDRGAVRSFRAESAALGAQLDASTTWKDVREVVDRWRGPCAVKGIMTADDARRAVDHGATAVVVSNHGGRQLDGVAASLEALPAIAAALKDRAEITMDGGIRRGVHVLKALALGARACGVGRAYLYGLAAGGEAGVARTLQLLRTEFTRALQLTGCRDVRDIDSSLVRHLE